MPTAELRIFTIVGKVPTRVEGKMWQAWKVDEYRESDRRLMATWYLLDEAPYMVAGDVFLANGKVQKAVEFSIP